MGKYSNYLVADSDEVVKKLSIFGFNGKYKTVNNKTYVYFEKDSLNVQFVGDITEEDLIKALSKEGAKIITDSGEGFEIEDGIIFDKYVPTNSFTSQMWYSEVPKTCFKFKL